MTFKNVTVGITISCGLFESSQSESAFDPINWSLSPIRFIPVLHVNNKPVPSLANNYFVQELLLGLLLGNPPQGVYKSVTGSISNSIFLYLTRKLYCNNCTCMLTMSIPKMNLKIGMRKGNTTIFIFHTF